MNDFENRLFEKAKERGIDFVSYGEGNTTETSLTVHNGEVETQQIGTSSTSTVKGIYKGKRGIYSSDSRTMDSLPLALEAVKETALYGKDDTIGNYFSGKASYQEAKSLRKDFVPSNLGERRKGALSLSEKIKKADGRIRNVDVSLSRVYEDGKKLNSLGLSCSGQTKFFSGSRYISAIDRKGSIRNGEKGAYSRLSLDDLRKKLEDKIPSLLASARDFFDPICLPSGSYPCIFSKERASTLLSYYRSQLSAKQVQKHLSLFEGKVGEKIRSDKRTILHTPHIEYRGSSSYDADGYPTKDFPVIENGILKTYFYSIESANEEKRESNGCSSGDGEGAPIVLTVGKGTEDLEGLFARRKDGIYITELRGLNSGIDDQSREFSLPCSGYVIKDGKKASAFDRNIVSGNLTDIFMKVLGLSSDAEITGGNVRPDRLVSGVDLSGNQE